MLKLTDVWNDSCSVEELTYALEHGSRATTNPVIVGEVLKKEMHLWEKRIIDIINDAGRNRGRYRLEAYRGNGAKGAELLMPVFEKEKAPRGEFPFKQIRSITGMPSYVEQAIHFNTLAPNMQVKILRQRKV